MQSSFSHLDSFWNRGARELRNGLLRKVTISRLLLLVNLSNEHSVPVILWKEHDSTIAELQSMSQAVGKILLTGITTWL